MAILRISLLGQPQISFDDEPIDPEFFGFKKACALLYYLAGTGQPQNRAKLAALLWPELPASKALSNLRGRSGLLALRPFADFLQRQGATLALLPQPNLTLDVQAFEQAVAHNEPSIEQLQQAAVLYRGEFLTGFDWGGASADFETWILTTRERLRSRAIDVFYRLMHYHAQWQEYDEAMGYAERLLAIEPWLEEAHRQLMLLQAYQGQRGKALAQYEVCSRVLSAELNAAPSPATTDVYDQIRENRLDPPSPIPFLAPPLTPHFVGRDDFLDQIIAQIDAASSPLLSLTGMGGIGKTTLATHIAHRLRKRFPDGVLWANALESKPEDVIDSWAAMYGYDFSGLSGVAARQVAWRGATEKKALLIIVDDVWEAAQIRPLLPSSPRCIVIMTTRNHDLATLLNAKVIGVPELAATAGVDLLRSILGEERISAEAQAAQQISTMLENLPLALEIIAQRLRSRPRMKLADIVRYLGEINSKLDMLHLEDRAVRASFELSWDILDDELREALALLGVFEGRTLDAAAFAAVLDCQEWEARERLEDLAALSLVKGDSSDHYRQHALLADFATEKGKERADFTEAQARFTDYYYRFAQRHCDDFEQLRPNWHNFQQAITIAHQQSDWHKTYNITEALRPAWLARGRFDELTTGHMLAHEAALALEDTEKIAEGLYNMGLAATEQARYPEAQQFLEHSLGLFEKELDLADGVIRTKLQLGRVALEQGDIDEASTLLSESHHLAVEQNDEFGIAMSAYRRSRIAFRAGEYEAAEELASEALRFQKGKSDLSTITRVLAQLATYNLVQAQKLNFDDPLRTHRLQMAAGYLNEAHELTERTKSSSDRSIVLLEFGWLYRLTGEEELAVTSLEKAQKMFSQMGDKQSEAQAIFRLSRLHEDAKRFEMALRDARKSEHIYAILEDNYNLIIIKAHIGDLLLALSHKVEASNYWNDALTLAQKAGHSRFVPPLQKRLADNGND